MALMHEPVPGTLAWPSAPYDLGVAAAKSFRPFTRHQEGKRKGFARIRLCTEERGFSPTDVLPGYRHAAELNEVEFVPFALPAGTKDTLTLDELSSHLSAYQAAELTRTQSKSETRYLPTVLGLTCALSTDLDLLVSPRRSLSRGSSQPRAVGRYVHWTSKLLPNLSPG